VNIANVRKVSDIATTEQTSFVKSSKDGLVYMWGCLVHMSIRKPVVCEHTNVFDVCNSMMAQSPISMIREYTDQESSVLNDLKTAFDDRVSLFLYPVSACSTSVFLTQNNSLFLKIFLKRFKKNFRNLVVLLLKVSSKPFVENSYIFE